MKLLTTYEIGDIVFVSWACHTEKPCLKCGKLEWKRAYRVERCAVRTIKITCQFGEIHIVYGVVPIFKNGRHKRQSHCDYRQENVFRFSVQAADRVVEENERLKK